MDIRDAPRRPGRRTGRGRGERARRRSRADSRNQPRNLGAAAPGRAGVAGRDRDSPSTIGGGQVPVTACVPMPHGARRARRARRQPGTTAATWSSSPPATIARLGDSVLAQAMRAGDQADQPVGPGRWTRSGRDGAGPGADQERRRWLAEALLDAQPPGGWRRLDRPGAQPSTALNRLAATRLGIERRRRAVRWTPPRCWSGPSHPDAVASFLQLRRRRTRRPGPAGWTRPSAPVAGDRLRHGRPGKLTDAVPFGLAIAAAVLRRAPGAPIPCDGPDPRRGTVPRRALRRAGGAACVRRGRRVAGRRGGPTTGALRRRPSSATGPRPSSADLAGSREMVPVLAGTARCSTPGFDARLAALGDAISAALANPAGETSQRRRRRWTRYTSTVASGTARRKSARPRPPLRLARWLASAEEPPCDRWPTPRRGCSGPGPGPTGPWSASPAPTPAGCRGWRGLRELCGTRPRPGGPGSTRRSRASWRPGRKARPTPTACCWSRTCSTASPARWPAAAAGRRGA